MAPPVRILLCDDSVVIRKLLTTTLGEVPGFEVVAAASLGKIAIAKIPLCNPDVVILDVEMPEMDGIETLRLIRREWPRLPVIMFSTRTERGAVATIEALTSGASDYVAKPSNVGSVLVAMTRVREEMVPKILALTGRRLPAAAPAAPAPPAPATPAPAPAPAAPAPVPPAPAARAPTAPIATRVARAATPSAAPPVVPRNTTSLLPVARTQAMPVSRTQTQPVFRKETTTGNLLLVNDGPVRLRAPVGPRPPVEILAIGASTGGPNALSVLLGALPAELPVPVVIVQHMLASFTRHFAERLAAQCRIKIVEATAGTALAPGCVYIARGDHHLLVERRGGRASLAMNQDELENFCRPAVDVLFRSVATSYGAGALAVVLTGMGHDGLRGCSAIRDAGGDVIVQDEASSVVWGMPGFIARAGLASQVVALDDLGGEIRRRVALRSARTLEAAP